VTGVRGPVDQLDLDRPVSARSVVASVLLPLSRPELPGRALIRCAELFGIAEGTCRVALSRMVTGGELTVGDGRYRLAGPLLARQARQDVGRRPRLRAWDGSWLVCVAPSGPRAAPERAALREELGRRRMGELRESVWVRPDNLPPSPAPGPAVTTVAAGCWWFSGARPPVIGQGTGPRSRRTADGADGDVRLAGALWDLPGWVRQAARCAALLAELRPRLEAGDTAALAPGFRVAAATVRHLTRDPLLPEMLLPVHWPGQGLRTDYDAFEQAYQDLLRDYLAR
jgi:phenylacetic acid degradation operon negative regulatory protein